MYYCLPQTQLDRLQHIQNAQDCSCNCGHIVRSLRWLKVQERIEWKLFPPHNKLLQSPFPRYLRDLSTLQPSQSTRSSTLVIVLQPSVDSSLKITNRTFRCAAPHLWNKFPPTLRVPLTSLSVRSIIITQLFSIVKLWSRITHHLSTFFMTFSTLSNHP